MSSGNGSSSTCEMILGPRKRVRRHKWPPDAFFYAELKHSNLPCMAHSPTPLPELMHSHLCHSGIRALSLQTHLRPISHTNSCIALSVFLAPSHYAIVLLLRIAIVMYASNLLARTCTHHHP